MMPNLKVQPAIKKQTNKNTKTNFLSSHALRCLLLCLSDNELLTVSKTLWKRDIILIKKSLHAGHVWYNYFFSFSVPFWLGNGLLKTQRMTSILLIYSLMTFLSSEQQKKYYPRAFLPLKFASTPDCSELLWTSASLCKCTEGIPCQRQQNGL